MCREIVTSVPMSPSDGSIFTAAPGSSPATDLPDVDDLLAFAASPLLTLPGR